MSASVVSLNDIRQEREEARMQELGYLRIEEMIDTVEKAKQQQREEGSLPEINAYEYLIIYLRAIQMKNPVLHGLVSTWMSDKLLKLHYPPELIHESDDYDIDDAWYCGITINPIDTPCPDLQLNIESAVESINRAVDNCRTNAIMIEPTGSVIGRILSQGMALVESTTSTDNTVRGLTFHSGGNDPVAVTLLYNIHLLTHLRFKDPHD